MSTLDWGMFTLAEKVAEADTLLASIRSEVEDPERDDVTPAVASDHIDLLTPALDAWDGFADQFRER